MKTTVINIKTTNEVKTQAQEIAKELGISLSSLINAYLKQLTRTKRVVFDLNPYPNEQTRQYLNNVHNTDTSPTFNSIDAAKQWLEEQTKK